jgi:xanthine dehydrogenase YagS FAD-binding subunit
MRPFAYGNASTVEDAVRALDEGCRPLAGGTDLIGLMKKGLAGPERLVNLKTIPELRGIEKDEEGWHIGALTTLSDLVKVDAGAQPGELAVLSQAAIASATPQLRHAATIGGNLLQRPRCWYFRNPLIHCWLKGGERCFAAAGRNRYHAILGGGVCHFVHPSDPAVALLALGAQITLVGPEGSRSLDVADFFRKPRQRNGSNALSGETLVETSELVTSLRIPVPPEGSRGAFAKVAERAAWDFALVSTAVQVSFEGDGVAEARVVLGGVAARPWRAREAEEALVGRPLSSSVMDAAAHAATADAEPLSGNGYKVRLVQGVVREALRRLRER